MINEYPFFPTSEHEERIRRVADELETRGWPGVLVTSPEGIYYLTGLSHQGYFTFTALVVPSRGQPFIIAREAERRTIADQVPWLEMIGYTEGQHPGTVTVDALRTRALLVSRLAVDQDGMYLPPAIFTAIAGSMHGGNTEDGSGIVERLMWVKSQRELACVRAAATVADAAMDAAIRTARAGTAEKDVVAAVYAAMIAAGGEMPGHAPFVRSNETIPQSHTSWRRRSLVPADVVFMELAGCVARYHAPVTRQVFVGQAPSRVEEAAAIAGSAHRALLQALKPGASSRDAYWAYQGEVDAALGHKHYRRIHCGYLVGVGFPPSWSGGSQVQGIRPDYEFEVQKGMVLHLWADMNGSGIADFIYSDTVEVTDAGVTVLTGAARDPIIT